MNTAQNYAEGNHYASTPPQSSLHLTQDEAQTWLDCLYFNDTLTDEERDWAKLIPVTDQAMAPQLTVGCGLVICEKTETEFEPLLSKVVAVTLKSEPQTYLIGRLTKINKRVVVLSRDNKEFGELTISRNLVLRTYEAKTLVNKSVL